MKELATHRKKLERNSDVANLPLLANLIHAIKDCVASLRERKHDALLNEVLGIRLWGSPLVCGIQIRGMQRPSVHAQLALHACLWPTAHNIPFCAAQLVRHAVLELVGNLVVSNAAFTHTCLQLLVYSFIPPPAPPSPETDQGGWTASDEATLVQTEVVSTLEKVGEQCGIFTGCVLGQVRWVAKRVKALGARRACT